MNKWQQRFLQALPPEMAHTVAFRALSLLHRLRLLKKLYPQASACPVTCFNINFQNPIGLSAGLDKNAAYLKVLGELGFGFIEVGTVTPRPQSGNAKPRLFRYPQQKALINRMGFNNQGFDAVKRNLDHAHYNGILGINIGKNKESENEQAIQDYVEGFKTFAPYAHYITVNISSPNTPGLRDWQTSGPLTQLLTALKEAQATYSRYVPLVVKVSPDITLDQVSSMAKLFLNFKIDGVIATNTTLSRPHRINTTEAGGLSGEPLNALSTKIIQQFSDAMHQKIPIIASGGIQDTLSLLEKQKAGARLFQVYTGFIYEGPKLIHDLVDAYSTVTDFAKFRG